MSGEQLLEHQARRGDRRAKLATLASYMRASTKALDPQDLEGIYKKYGITRPKWQDAADTSLITDARDWIGTADKRSAVALWGALHQRRAALANSFGQDTPAGEIGAPGTPIYSGLLAIEPVARMSPYLARGYAGSSGIFEDLLRDPIVYQATESIKQVLVAGDWHIAYPKDIPEGMRPQVESAGDWVWGMLLGLRDSWPQYVEDAASTVPFGFSTFEAVWGERDSFGRIPLVRLGYREQSTVESWLMSARGAELLGVRYQTGGDSSYRYVLPAYGEALTDHRVIVNTIAGRGNNFEGLSPLRTIEPLVTLKRLLLAITGSTAERYGSPILTSRTDTDLIAQAKGFAAKEDDLDAFLDDLIEMVAMDTPAMHVPPGLILEYVGTKGEMPEYLETIKYCDQQIEMAFNNQGALLGQNQAGSWALSKTQDNAFLRGAPYWAQACVTKSLNKLIRRILQAPPFNLRLRHYPEVAWRLGASGDVGMWMEGIAKLIELAPKMPPEVLKAALDKYELSPDAFNDLTAQRMSNAEQDQQRVYKITNALKSGVVARTPEVVRALHQLLDLPEPTDAQIAELLQQTVPGAPQDPDVVAPEEVV